MGVETTIDGKRCLFTADNFFHQDQFSGTGGWMGLNRSSPAVYGTSAKKVLDIAPGVGAGRARRAVRVQRRGLPPAGEVGRGGGQGGATRCASAATTCRDWNPHRVDVEPVLQTAKPGDELEGRVRLSQRRPRRPQTVTVTLRGRGLVADQHVTLDVRRGPSKRSATVN